jgi:E3 ubiquitin-protein ligase RGLG
MPDSRLLLLVLFLGLCWWLCQPPRLLRLAQALRQWLPASLAQPLASLAESSLAAAPGTSSTANEDVWGSTAELKDDLRRAGMESCNLVVAIDHTQSNTFTGRRTYGGRCLHELGPSLNFYEQALSMVARTLREFDEDGLIPAYGFGSLQAKSTKLFCYQPEDAPCQGLPGVLARYRELVPHVTLSGGTSFAPAILRACEITAASQPPQYHILLLVCDGQVSEECKEATLAAIRYACHFPLSIVCVGVGDGPWEDMQQYDDMSERAFDNFQFVSFESTMQRARQAAAAAGGAQAPAVIEEHFALAALMEIPAQFREIRRRGLLQAITRPAPPSPVQLLPPPRTAQGQPAAASAPRANDLAAQQQQQQQQQGAAEAMGGGDPAAI